MSRTQTMIGPGMKELNAGDVFAGRYRVLDFLGRGGMGYVYKVHDEKLAEVVALKILKPEIAADERNVERFKNEVRLARRISHQHVCRVHDLGEASGALFITMEYVSGEDLRSLVKRLGRLPASRAASLAGQVCLGLTQAHRLGVLHRDLKPQNIMIDDEGRVRILDFGIARLLDTGGLTQAGSILGSPEYMSPEQIEGQETDVRTDIYALGVILYEMTTGAPPFLGETALSTALKHKTEPFPDPRERCRDIPEELVWIIRRCMEKKKGDRFQDAEALRASLASIGTTSPSRLKKARRRPVLQSLFRPWWKAVLWALLAVLIAASGVYLLRPRQGVIDSIAVLPFSDLSQNRDQENFCEGLTEFLISKLARIGSLRVVPRTTVMRYRNAARDIREIGRELDVPAVMEGSVQKEEEDIRISVSLIRVSDGTHLWSNTFERKLQSIFAIQDEISQAVIDSLKIQIGAEQKYFLDQRHTRDPKAYSLYLEARSLWNRMDTPSLQKAVGLYREALGRDPRFALAQAGLADSLNLLAAAGVLPSGAVHLEAKEAALRAVELDDKLAEARATLAWVKHHSDWDWTGAEIEYNWAIGLNPGYTVAYHWYAEYLRDRGRFEEALTKFEQARALDPNSLSIQTGLAWFYYYSGEEDRAAAQCRSILAANPDWLPAHRCQGFALLQQRRVEEAKDELQKASGLSAGNPAALVDIGYGMAVAGRRAEAEKILKDLDQLSASSFVSSFSRALIQAGLKNADEAFSLLENSLKERDVNLVTLKIDPRFDNLRHDPRFRSLTERLGLD